jgi:hypothetical protein
LTVVLLAAYLSGIPGTIWAAIGLCAVMAVHYFLRVRSFKRFPVQIRLAFLLMLVAGLFPAMRWIHWVQLAGTTARITVGYCALARLLTLLPWNRDVPFTLTLVRQLALAAPSGGLVRVVPADTKVDGCSVKAQSCSLSNRPSAS